MKNKICSAFNGTRFFQCVLLMMLVAVGQGCTLDPADGSRLATAITPVTFSGYSSRASDTVILEALNSADVWTEIGRATSGTANVNSRGATPLYGYSLKRVVPLAYWREVTTPANTKEYKVTVRMRIGTAATYTFTKPAQDCVYNTIGAGTQADLVTIGRQCTTGSTISLTANVLKPWTPGQGGGGSTTSPSCTGEGALCQTHPAECTADAGFTVTGSTVCRSGKLVCEAQAGRDFCTGADGAACGGAWGNACGVGALCAPGLVCAGPNGRTTCNTGCTTAAGFCYTTADVGRESAGCFF